MTKTEHRAILKLTRRIKALSDPTDQSECTVAPAHKEAARLFLTTWVLPAMNALSKPAKEREHHERRSIEITANEWRNDRTEKA